MSGHSILRLLILCAVSSCSPAVPVGSDVLVEDETGCEKVTLASVACPATPWGPQLSFASVASLEEHLIGRWEFCGGQKRYTGRGELTGFPHGSGIELWSDAGQLRFAFLRRQGRVLVRSQAPSQLGTVQLRLENGRGRAVLSTEDSAEVVWNTDFFADQAVLQNGAFDVWNFVAAE
jgi:hypothetical protein